MIPWLAIMALIRKGAAIYPFARMGLEKFKELYVTNPQFRQAVKDAAKKLGDGVMHVKNQTAYFTQNQGRQEFGMHMKETFKKDAQKVGEFLKKLIK